MGLTKRWSLYVASHGNSRVRAKALRIKAFADLSDACIRTHRLVCGL